ncbi:MAG TPA: TagF domain-containing protein [Thermoanaerobaculia bacterium]|jgi:type VI secretion system ImpM family protein|nr:TagF domain-containing protein [Thermoanaerobaculia bacterium]
MATKGEEESPSFLEALGSLFGSGPKVVRPAFSVYGKLPIYKDFLRHGLASQEAQAFRQWLDKGFSRYWDGDPACRDHVIGPHLFSLRFEGLGRRVVGGLWGSHDQGELRRFPFALFVSVPAGGAFGDLAVLGILGQVAEKARDLRHALGQASDVQGFYHLVREATLTLRIERDSAVRERLARELAGLTVGAFAESLYGEAAGERWPALLAYLERRRAAAASGQAGGRAGGAPPLACRLGISGSLPTLCQSQLWAAVLQGAGEKSRAPFNVLLSWEGEPAGGMVLFERDLRPDDVFAFHPDPPRADLLEDLRHDVPTRPESPERPSSPAAAAATAASPAFSGGAAWDRPLASLLEPGALRASGGA